LNRREAALADKAAHPVSWAKVRVKGTHQSVQRCVGALHSQRETEPTLERLGFDPSGVGERTDLMAFAGLFRQARFR
jgi:hypothetical protein